MKIYIVLKNADWIEGRGPMLFHKAFITEKAACDYIDSYKVGIYGANPPHDQTMSKWIKSGKTGGWGGFEIKEVEAD